MERLKIVTGYVDIPGHPRGAADYEKLGGELVAGLKAAEIPVVEFRYEPTQTVLFGSLRTKQNQFPKRILPSVADNPAKNTAIYHCVQHEKFFWLARAAIKDTDDTQTFVWIDYGILHVPGVTVAVIVEYLRRLRTYGCIMAPGCWPKRSEISQNVPCWRFCGGLIAVPAKMVNDLAQEVLKVSLGHILQTNNIEWEVNTLAKVELLNIFPLVWYKADHDATMFTGAP